MNILICDDIQAEAEKLTNLINNSGFNINLKVFYNGYDVLDYTRSGASVDVFFLDIVMPEISGITLAEELRAGGSACEIVFLTSSNEYAAESYTVNAFSYLLKPPTSDSVRNILCKLENMHKNGDTEGILVKNSGMARFILFRDISHVEVIQHKVYFRLSDGDEAEANVTFREITPQLLNDTRFIQCHRSFVVNMNAVSAITGREIIMRNGEKIPISRSYPDVKKRYLQWVFGSGIK